MDCLGGPARPVARPVETDSSDSEAEWAEWSECAFEAEMVKLHGEDWINKNLLARTTRTYCPGLEEGWLVCTMCHKQLAGLYTIYAHCTSRRHVANLEWMSKQAVEGPGSNPPLPAPSQALQNAVAVEPCPKWLPIVDKDAPLALPAPARVTERAPERHDFPRPPPPSPGDDLPPWIARECNLQQASSGSFAMAALPATAPPPWSALSNHSITLAAQTTSTRNNRKAGVQFDPTDIPSWVPPIPSAPLPIQDHVRHRAVFSVESRSGAVPVNESAEPQRNPLSSGMPPDCGAASSSKASVAFPPPPPLPADIDCPPLPTSTAPPQRPTLAAVASTEIVPPKMPIHTVSPSTVPPNEQRPANAAVQPSPIEYTSGSVYSARCAYDAMELGENGVQEHGYLILEVDWQVTMISNAQQGHTKNRYPEYAWAKRVRDGIEGWVPLKVLVAH